jgi:hypothetical protein
VDDTVQGDRIDASNIQIIDYTKIKDHGRYQILGQCQDKEWLRSLGGATEDGTIEPCTRDIYMPGLT